MVDISQQLHKFCKIFHLRLISIDDQSGTLNPRYLITMMCENYSPLADDGTYYYLVGDTRKGVLCVCEEDMFFGTTKSLLVPIQEFTINLYEELIEGGWEYSNGNWV